MRSSGVRRPRSIRSSSTARQAASPSPPMFLTASSTFCPSRRTPSTTSSETLVGPAVEPHADHGAVEDQPDHVLAGQVAPAPGLPVGLHLAPGAADDVLADRAPEQ